MAGFTKLKIAPRTPPPSQGGGGGDYDSVPPDDHCSAVAGHKLPAAPISPPENTRPRKRRRVNRITRPEPGSLYDILHENQGESLFIIPICWQDQHARLLGVQWSHRATVRRPVPDFNSMSFKYPPRPTQVATDLSRDLTTILTADPSPLQLAALKSVMSTMFPATLSRARSEMNLEIRFGDQVLKRGVRVPLMWKQYEQNSRSFDSASTKLAESYGRIPSSSRQSFASQDTDWRSSGSQSWSDQPVLAFINRTHLHQVRSNLYRVAPGPNNSANVPVDNLQKLRCKRLVPQNADQDSYLVAIMLAIAQWQCYPQRRYSSRWSSQNSSQASRAGHETSLPQPEFRDIPVKIITQDHDAAEFVIYSAVVTAAFLQRFAFPSKAPHVTDTQDGGLKIEVTRVQIWPVLGLKERLAKALGPQIAGDLASHETSGTDIETWETEQERAFRLGNLKRKREALSEVFNKSFESTEGGSPLPVGLETGLGITVASPPVSPRTPKRRRTQSNTQLEVC
ncbi:hypothetical protein J7T55_006635 [Diaporthe amygdali]|uniref:uncharacterized protein n=1 Tax=Phomopsis amygdali TaxID=1214568 RepID=UPI0022FF2DB7|nr:uncharacterized protein J7T55_006635 [Diaporthe amygdali]KAJ0125290.1 hypothetical protein J7T55_006635 [Diaporthe amygdali]